MKLEPWCLPVGCYASQCCQKPACASAGGQCCQCMVLLKVLCLLGLVAACVGICAVHQAVPDSCRVTCIHRVEQKSRSKCQGDFVRFCALMHHPLVFDASAFRFKTVPAFSSAADLFFSVCGQGGCCMLQLAVWLGASCRLYGTAGCIMQFEACSGCDGTWACTHLPYGTFLTRLFTCLHTSCSGVRSANVPDAYTVGAEQHRLCARCAGCICVAAVITCTCTRHVSVWDAAVWDVIRYQQHAVHCTTGAAELCFVQCQEWYAAELVMPNGGGVCCAPVHLARTAAVMHDRHVL
jgi:hypothetical protein